MLTAKKNPGVSSRTEQKFASSETPTDVTEASVKHRSILQAESCLLSFCRPQRPQHRALHRTGAQTYSLNEKPKVEVSGGGREMWKEHSVRPRLHPKGTDTSGLQMLLKAMLERTGNSTDVSLTEWYESWFGKLIFKNLSEKNILKIPIKN